ncbi:hypothetical protein JCM8547_008885 [Rhodosporidiobolus lusitaniae]
MAGPTSQALMSGKVISWSFEDVFSAHFAAFLALAPSTIHEVCVRVSDVREVSFEENVDHLKRGNHLSGSCPALVTALSACTALRSLHLSSISNHQAPVVSDLWLSTFSVPPFLRTLSLEINDWDSTLRQFLTLLSPRLTTPQLVICGDQTPAPQDSKLYFPSLHTLFLEHNDLSGLVSAFSEISAPNLSSLSLGTMSKECTRDDRPDDDDEGVREDLDTSARRVAECNNGLEEICLIKSRITGAWVAEETVFFFELLRDERRALGEAAGVLERAQRCIEALEEEDDSTVQETKALLNALEGLYKNRAVKEKKF